MSLSLSLDLASYIYSRLNHKKIEKYSTTHLSVSVIIPAYNESENLEKAIRAQYEQTKLPKNVVVINDNSVDDTEDICFKMQFEFPNLIVVNNKINMGKAAGIDYVVHEYDTELGDIIYVNDGDSLPDKNCLEELIRGFDSPEVAAVSGQPIMVGSGSLLSRAITNGKKWQIEAFQWRKVGQTARNGMYVLCGAVMAIRKDIMKKYSMPTRTRTEDLDYTWILHENGYKLRYQTKAICYSHDVVGLKDQWKQTRRWSDGAWQALYCHGKDLMKSKQLLFTSILPSIIDTLFLMIRVLIIIAPMFYFNPIFLIGIFIANILALGIASLVTKPSYIKHVPAALLYSAMWSASYLMSAIEITFQKLCHQEIKWRNKWSKNMPIIEVVPEYPIALPEFSRAASFTGIKR